MSLIKRNTISQNLEDYSIAVLGEAGIGKTTLMVETCEKEFGADGYVIFNMGAEQGVDCIDGAAYIDIPDWKTLDATIKELIKNRDTDYKNVKVIVYDTLDQLFEFGEKEVIRRWNVENVGEKNFRTCTSINSAYAGFGKGLDKNIEIIIKTITDLQAAGYRVWYTAHLKSRDIVDAVSGDSYTQLTASMPQKYFNAIKDKMHCVGVACIDRTIEAEGTGRKNVVTKQEITVKKVKEERRKIVFRDDNYSIDSKSRFKNIVSEIALDTDEFIKALKDAIVNSKRDGAPAASTSAPKAKATPAPAPVVEEEVPFEEEPVEADPEIEAMEETENLADKEARIEECRNMFKTADKDVKVQVKKLLNGGKLAIEMDDDVLSEIYELLTSEV